MLNSGGKNILTLVLSGKKILNEKKKHSNGKFHTHIANTIKSASQRLCAIRKLKYVFKNRHYLARIYLIFIRPMFEYACELWDDCSQQDSDNLEKLQLGRTNSKRTASICKS